MEICLKLAKKGSYKTHPNPQVGALIVKDNKIISQGYHHKFGKKHAEIDALEKINFKATGTTLYCTLEPCCHQGKTPPCTQSIIKSGISKVVLGSSDNFEKVNNKGIKQLKDAGIEVITGILEEECKKLNKAFFFANKNKIPLGTIKAAASLDSKSSLKNGKSKWITSNKAREYARKQRDYFSAILVGINTVIKDNPNLGGKNRDPLRIILDPHLKISVKAQVLRDDNCIVFCKSEKIKQKDKAKIVKTHFNKIVGIDNYSLKEILTFLFKEKNIISLLVEGGSKTIGYFLQEKLAHELNYYFEPILLGNKAKEALPFPEINNLTESIKIKNTSIKKLGSSFLLKGEIEY